MILINIDFKHLISIFFNLYVFNIGLNDWQLSSYLLLALIRKTLLQVLVHVSELLAIRQIVSALKNVASEVFIKFVLLFHGDS
jgi:hypothetical protein